MYSSSTNNLYLQVGSKVSQLPSLSVILPVERVCKPANAFLTDIVHSFHTANAEG